MDARVAAYSEGERQQAMGRLLAGAIEAALAQAAWVLIEGARRIVILAHEHPDPDALGSALGLALTLEPLGKECVVACADPVPLSYTFLPGRERVVTSFDVTQVDLVVALDAGELGRYGALYTRYQDFFESATILNIDHHVTSSGCGRVNIIDPRSAATAEIVTTFLLHQHAAIGEDAARCLLAGIITDTRAFEFEATTSRTLLAGAYLVGCGAVPEEIIKPMYRMRPLEKVRLWSLTIDRTLSTSADGRLVWATLRQDFLAETGATPDMDDGLPSYLMDIEGVAISALFKEQADGTTKVSLRATEPYDAARIAAHYGGGGHVRASGFSLAREVDAAMLEVIPYLEGQFEGGAR